MARAGGLARIATCPARFGLGDGTPEPMRAPCWRQEQVLAMLRRRELTCMDIARTCGIDRRNAAVLLFRLLRNRLVTRRGTPRHYAYRAK